MLAVSHRDCEALLAAVRAGNHLHRHSFVDSSPHRKAKAELLEYFCPHSPPWRKRVIKSSLVAIDQATLGILRTTG
jgi:hypothetical protein